MRGTSNLASKLLPSGPKAILGSIPEVKSSDGILHLPQKPINRPLVLIATTVQLLMDGSSVIICTTLKLLGTNKLHTYQGGNTASTHRAPFSPASSL